MFNVQMFTFRFISKPIGRKLQSVFHPKPNNPKKTKEKSAKRKRCRLSHSWKRVERAKRVIKKRKIENRKTEKGGIDMWWYSQKRK